MARGLDRPAGSDDTGAMSALLRPLLHLTETVGALLVYGILRLLPLDAATALGSMAMRTIGPLLPLQGVARRNLERAFPDAPPARIEAILKGMWDNLGRTAGEFVHLRRLNRELDSRVEIQRPDGSSGLPVVERLAREGGPAIMLSGHLANWELLGAIALSHGLTLDMVYRAPSNPMIRGLYDTRRLHPESRMIEKGAAGAREIIRSLKEKRVVAMLVDQKMNDGVEARFFGQKAMTASAFADLAVRRNLPLLPARIERLEGSRFRVTLYDPLEIPTDGTTEEKVLALVQQANDLLESWIRERPEQWLWVHRRWPKPPRP